MSNLPKLADLYNDLPTKQKEDALNVLLNQDPKPEWVLINKFANSSRYLPIERVEWLLKSIFKNFKIEVRSIQQVFNGVSATVRVHYQHPVSGEWLFHDGVGASQIQTKRGSSPADLSNINNNAVSLCVPIAKSEAVKNACKSFGKLFGSDLNRSQIAYEIDSSLVEMHPEHPNWEKCVDAIKSGKFKAKDIADKYFVNNENLEKLKKYEKV